MNWDKIAVDLELVCNGPVLRNESMVKHTSFRVGGPADILLQPTSVEEIQKIIGYLQTNQIPWQVIGNGSNLLVCDEGIEGVVIQLGSGFSTIQRVENQLICQSGALLSAIASFALESGLTGFEFAGGIPGSIGGAVVMNAGAYGGEMKDVLINATVLTLEGSVEVLSLDALELSYRHSVIAERGYIVLEAVISLSPGNIEEIRSITKELTQKRVSKQPLHLPSAGSTFKRPTGYFAGQLIDEAGLRGLRYGDAQVSEKHCGFVVNLGDATCQEVVTLMKLVRRMVLDQFGVELEPEVRMVGRRYGISNHSGLSHPHTI